MWGLTAGKARAAPKSEIWCSTRIQEFKITTWIALDFTPFSMVGYHALKGLIPSCTPFSEKASFPQDFESKQIIASHPLLLQKRHKVLRTPYRKTTHVSKSHQPTDQSEKVRKKKTRKGLQNYLFSMKITEQITRMYMKWELGNGKVKLLNNTVAGTPVLTETKTPQLLQGKSHHQKPRSGGQTHLGRWRPWRTPLGWGTGKARSFGWQTRLSASDTPQSRKASRSPDRRWPPAEGIKAARRETPLPWSPSLEQRVHSRRLSPPVVLGHSPGLSALPYRRAICAF